MKSIFFTVVILTLSLNAFSNEENNDSSTISIKPYTGIYKDKEVVKNNIKLIEAKSDSALQTVLTHLGIEQTIGKIDIIFDDTKYKMHAVAYSKEINSKKREIIHFIPKHLTYNSYNVEKKLIHELTHAVMRDLLTKEQYKKIPRWFKEGIAVWAADQIEEKEAYSVSYSVFKNESPSLLINGISGKHTINDYYEDGLFFDYLEKTYGIDVIHKLIQLILSGNDYKNALITSTESSVQDLKKNSRQYSNNRLNNFLKASNYDEYLTIQKPKDIKRNNANWAKAKAEYKNFITSYPKSVFVPNAIYQIARSNMNLRDFSEAIKQYDHILLNNTYHVVLFRNSLYHKGLALTEMRKKEQAIELFKQFLDFFPNQGYSWTIDELLIKHSLIKEEAADFMQEKEARASNTSSTILIKPYTGIFKNNKVLLNNIKLIETQASTALQTAIDRLDIKNDIGKIGIKFSDKLESEETLTIPTYLNNRITIIFNTRKLLINGYNIENKLIYEFIHAIIYDALKERSQELPRWFKDGIAIWGANQLEEHERYLVSWSVLSNKPPLQLINPIEGSYAFKGYYEDGLFFDYLEKEYGKKAIQKLVKLIISGSDYHSAFKTSTGFDLQNLQENSFQYSSNRLNKFLEDSNYEDFKEIKKQTKEKKLNWIKIKANIENFIKQNPESIFIPNAIYQLGRTNIKLKDYPEATKQFDNVLDNSRNIILFRHSLYQKALALMEEKKKKQAGEQFKQYLDIFPEIDKSSINKYIKKGLITPNIVRPSS